MKNSNDIKNRTRDLPACSAAPQPTAPPRAPLHYSTSSQNSVLLGDLPRRVCEPRSSYDDAVEVVLLRFVLMAQTHAPRSTFLRIIFLRSSSNSVQFFSALSRRVLFVPRRKAVALNLFIFLERHFLFVT